ncbi:MAG TPA: YdeI/OmpD-associated family protein [candidate division Zixibacteria bacterium]|nr:YdeI/OmpD-associated family protein [candidate division Zixibacteria bacterium]
MNVKNSLKILAFKTAKDWKKWLGKNHAKSAGIWLRFFKKGSGVPSVTYAEALDEALCHGWIDSQLQKYDEISYLQKFTPRRPKSLWSKRNIEHVGRLVKEGRMQFAGRKEMEAARKDGRWEQAYDSSGTMKVPKDFLEKLSKNKKAKAFFEKLNRSNIYAIAWRLQTAQKPQTRSRRMKALLAMLAEGKKLH